MGTTAYRFITPLSVLFLSVILWSVQAAALPPNGPITHAETRTGGSASSTTVATSASLTGVNDHLYLAAISTQPQVQVVSISGLGLSWTLVKAQCSGLNTTGVEVWMAQGTPSGNDVVTATLAGAADAAVIAVSRYAGVVAVNPLGEVISGNPNGANASAICTGGVPSAGYAFNLTTTENNAVVYSAATMKGRTHAPGAGYTERAEVKQVGGGLTSSVAVEDKTVATAGSVTVNGFFSGTADWAEVGLELKSAPILLPQYTLSVNTINAGTVTLDPPGGVYDAGTIVTLTATPGAGMEFTGWGDALSGTTNPATITMTNNRKVTANFKVSAPAGGPIVYEGVKSGSSTNATTVTTSGSMAGVAGNLYLAAISTQPKVSVVSVSGLGLNWTVVRAKCSGRGTTGIEVWMAHGTPSGSGTITATLGSAPESAVIAVTRYSGVAEVNPVGNAITANTTGTNLNALCSGGVDTSAYAIGFGTNLNNGVVYSAVALKDETHTSGPSFTERCEVQQRNSGNVSALAVQDQKVDFPSAVTVDGSFVGAVDWAAAALVIKPKIPQYTLSVSTINGGSVTLDPPGGIYEAGTLVTLTATPDAGSEFTGWSYALSGTTNPATLKMNTNRKVTANFTPSAPSSSPIVYEGLKIGSAVNSATVTSAGGMAGVAGNLYLAAISTQPKTDVVSVSGLGLSWSLVSAKCSGRGTTGIEVWMAQGTPSGSGNISAALASVTSTAVIAVSRYSGVAEANPLGNMLAGNTTGLNENGVCTGGTDNGAYSFDLATSVDNAVVYGAAALNGETHTPGTDFSERGEVRQLNGEEVSAVAVEEKTVAAADTVTVNGAFSGAVDWALVAVEIKPTSQQSQQTLTVNKIGAGSVTLDPPGGVYDAGMEVTLTATPDAGFEFSGWSGDLSGSTNPATITMDGNKSVTATFTAIPSDGIVHAETQTGGSAGSATVVTSATLVGVNGDLYLAAISTRPRVEVTAVAGLGLNWSLVKAQCSGRSQTGIEIWMAQGTPSGNAAVTATLATAPTTAVITVSRYSGVTDVNPIGNILFGNTNGANGACENGADNNSYSLDLLTTENDAVVYSAVAMRSRTHTPGAGYTERAEGNQGGTNSFASSIAVQDQSIASPSNVAVTGSFSGSVDWALVALELRPQGSGALQFTLTVNTVGTGSVDVNPASATYQAGTIVTLTATPGAGFQFSGWSGDLSGSANPATITMDASKNVTAIFTPSGSGEGIVHEETQTGGASNSNTVTTSASLVGVSDHLYLAAIATRPREAVNAVSGLGLNWTLVKAQCSGRDLVGVEVWMAQGTPSSNGTVTATLSGSPSNSVIAVSRYSGVWTANPIGNMVSGNTVGAAAACSLGVDNDTYSFDITTTVDGAVVYGATTMRMRTHTPGAGYTERAELQQGTTGGSMASIAVEDTSVASASTLAVNGSFSGTVDWAVVALELKPQPPQYTLTVNTAGSGSVALNPLGGTYDAGTVVTLTATPVQGFLFSGWSGDLSGSANPAMITMNANKTVTATFTVNTGVAYQESQTGGSSNSDTVATSTSLTAVEGQLYLAAISTRPQRTVAAVNGLGLSWTLVKAQCSGRDLTGVEVWMAQGTPSGDGAVTATLESAATNAVIAVSRYSGAAVADPVGNVVSGNTNGADGACANGVDNSLYSFDLTTTVDGAVAYGAASMRSRTHTPGTGYTERAEIQQGTGGAITSVAVESKFVASAGAVTIDGTLSGDVDWAVVGLEIKPEASASLAKRGGTTTENEKQAGPPLVYLLEQNYPNPFNPSTMISFALPAAGRVTVKIYSETGQLVRTLRDGEMAAGRHEINWNGKNQAGSAMASGIYLYQIVARGQNGEAAFTQTRRMTLLK